MTDYKKACSAGYRLDHLNSNNLLIDEENKSINLIDMERVNPDGTVPHYANLLYSLTNCAYFDTYTYDYPNPVSDEEKNADNIVNNTIIIHLNISESKTLPTFQNNFNKQIEADKENTDSFFYDEEDLFLHEEIFELIYQNLKIVQRSDFFDNQIQ